jgi:hypothetical protein
MRDYMYRIGWEKVADHRGISTSRTIEKMTEWAWLLGDEVLIQKIQNSPYAQYGAPKLKAICEHMGWPIPDSEEIQRMSEGLPCSDTCELGCGR